MGAVVGGEPEHPAAGEPARELQDAGDAGAPEPVDRLVIVAYHGHVAVGSGQTLENSRLDPGDVLIFVHHQVADVPANCGGDIAVLQHPVGPRLEVGEVHQVPLPEQLPVAPARTPHGGEEGTLRTGQNLGVDQLVADAVEIPGGLRRTVYSLAPAATGQYVPVRAQYGVKLLLHQQLLLRFVQQPVAGPQSHRAGVGSEYPVAEAVHGADPHPGEVPGNPAVPGGTQEPLPKLTGRAPAEGAEHQLAGQALPGEQQVHGAELDAERLARPGAGDDQQGAVPVSNDRPLVGVQLRVQAQNYWRGVHGSPWLTMGRRSPEGLTGRAGPRAKRSAPRRTVTPPEAGVGRPRPAPAGSTARSACPGARC